MKAKIKAGNQLLFVEGCHFDNIEDTMIINFADKGTYKAFQQRKNHLLIDTTEGEIDIVFTGKVPQLKFENYEKDQLVLNCV